MTTTAAGVGVGVVGTGWMAATHAEALRRLGHDVVGVAGRTAERAREALPAVGARRAYRDLDEMLGDPDVEVVHVTSPNDVHAAQAAAALRTGRHVVCEKPLGVSATQTAELLALARSSGLVHAVCLNARFYPQVQNAAGLVADGAVGSPRLVTGSYHQDWLARDTDWNWRLDATRQGQLRAVADIGSHVLDLVEFVSGARIVEVVADLHTFLPQRVRPDREVGTFAGGAADGGTTVAVNSDDAAGLLLRLDGGARGTCSVSQVSTGRKNRLSVELSGSESSLAWCSEDPERLWVGHRERPNEVVAKDPALMTAAGRAAARYPAGHVEGYPDTFCALFDAVYADVRAGAPATDPRYPTFAAGHDVALVADAVLDSSRTRSWSPVRR